MEIETADEVAIVGIGCNFPGGDGIDNFWKVLEEGKNCTVEIPPERFNAKEWYDPDDNKPGKICTTRAALLDEFNSFDNHLFGINNMEAERMDPQQKLLIECTYKALEDAGVPVEAVSGTKTGVFVGLMNRDYEIVTSRAVSAINHYDGTGTAMSIAANRVSFTFNLTGPSLTIDTACSSFLFALHYALRAIKSGDCEAAICGGVNCIIDPRTFVSLSKAKMISPEGISKPFSKKADGYGRGEGCGVVFLKPLKKAKEDYSKIWGVINISAVNQNGRSTTPITRPSPTEQEKLLRSIYGSRVDPSVVQYIEAHGTGTAAGDPIEAESLGSVIGKNRSFRASLLKIGSVKGNIGHTESAAGAAGLIKVLLMMHHGKIVPSLHYSKEMSSIDTEKLKFAVATAVEPWEESSEYGRVAGINCFGFGGTNAHIVVRQVKQPEPLPAFKRPLELFLLSAASSKSLQMTMADTAEQLSTRNTVTLPSLAYTSACRRSHANYRYRKAFVTNSLQHLQQELKSASTEPAMSKVEPQLVFVFCGNGVTLKEFSEALLSSEPVFRDKCKEIEDLFRQHTAVSVLPARDHSPQDLLNPELSQPLLFTLQVAVASLLKYWGIEPVAVVGHSVGEVAAAHIAGYLSLADAVQVIYHRSRLQAKTASGRMLVVGNIPVQEIAERLHPYSGKVCIAAFNSPVSCTLSGNVDSVETVQRELAQAFRQRNIFLHVLNVPAAYHSPSMDMILEELEEKIEPLGKQKGEIEVISTLTGVAASENDFARGKFWARHTREPVAFSQAIQSAARDRENVVFVEISPHRALQRSIKETLGKGTKVFSSLETDAEYQTLLTLVGNLFELGYNPKWQHFYNGYQSVPVAIPHYQFDRQKLMAFLNAHQQANQRGVSASHPLIYDINSDNMEFGCLLSQDATPYLYEHKNNGVALVPGAFYAELGLASVMSSSRPKVPLSNCQLSIVFSAPCVLTQSSQVLSIKLNLQKDVTAFEILSSSNAVYAAGQVAKGPEAVVEESTISFQDIYQRCRSVISREEVYEALSQVGFQYGSIFRQLSDVHYCQELKEAITSLKVNKETVREMYSYCIHPVLLDCFLQMTAVLTSRTFQSRAGFPSGIGSLVVLRPLEEEMMIYMRTNKSTGNCLEVCGCFLDKHGSVLAELKRVAITFIKEASSRDNEFLFENKWKEVSLSQTIGHLGVKPRVLVFADEFGIAEQLKKYLHPASRYVMYEDWEALLEGHTMNKMRAEVEDYDEILFLWGIQKLSEDFPSKVVDQLAKCCEAYRQVVVALREKTSPCSVKVITYRTRERYVDQVNCGFVLYGMTRSCVVEVPEITFQLIDLSSCSSLDISVLADVLVKCRGGDYPEVCISQGRIYVSEIRHTPFIDADYIQPVRSLQKSQTFTLYTSDPYTVKDLSGELSTSTATQLDKQSVEIQVDKICVHSEDYFPISVSSCNFGNTLYWNSQAGGKHRLLALDFSGTVTATGTDVKKVKVGDHVVSCYPTAASSRVRIPGIVCFNVKKFPFFQNVPCVSYFIIAWEIFTQRLPKGKHGRTLGIITTEPLSVLCHVLCAAAEEMGWRTVLARPTPDKFQYINLCNALVVLPPVNRLSWEDLAHMYFLKDVVIVCGNRQSECIQNVIEIGHENISFHILTLASVFQKAPLKELQKTVHVWVSSMDMKRFRRLSGSVFQQTENFERLNSVMSYFTCTSVPLAVLRRQKDISMLSDIPLYEPQKQLFKQNAVYVVVGGLTGLGFETVKFIAENGGGCIAILSRRILSNEKQEEMKALQQQYKGSKVVFVQCDVTLTGDVEKAFKSIANTFVGSPIKGVFQGAVALHDGHLEVLTLADFQKVLSPKVAGTLNLHWATRGQELDYFVCYSSVASFLGNATQTNYAAANSFLDLFCLYRRNRGLSGQSINWGALNLGILLNQNHIQSILRSKGIDILQVHEIHEYLRKSLLMNNPQQAVVKLNFQALYHHVFTRISSLKTRFISLMSEDFRYKLETPEETQVPDTAFLKSEDYITSLVSDLTGLNPEELTMNTPLSSLGIDSMLAMTIQNRVFQERKVDIPLLKLLDPHTTLSSLVIVLEETSNANGVVEKKNGAIESAENESRL
ncbi:highly reducing polyketide synthase curS1-like [Chiroxiphia lanceolata]|uniref:highly reducing polyketide synthase curS1-like n=1 Tax=Chiroxiphia lanceolata TaxID=296741 RepID=UPI0013CEB383|nr:highly reducing polyketide synthase curS1-like [Chiroxiphia lanceolata]XP_032567848.1 highly reducing polyketide synthase curS1-like [Chiroxiphia lanceolata]XP_032567857.1 highly reducing polyketide synthase curS1-like [Chiroxiphia lanceolata]XP_032567868.1 highly reducing polyketide synthase curS1-like [Chiroxiphia lanceolata]